MKKLILVFAIGSVLLATGLGGWLRIVFAAEVIAFGNITALSGPAAPWGIPRMTSVLKSQKNTSSRITAVWPEFLNLIIPRGLR